MSPAITVPENLLTGAYRVGAAVFMLLEDGFKEFQHWRALGMGLILPLFVALLPSGLVGLFRSRRLNVPPSPDAEGGDFAEPFENTLRKGAIR